jgi:hypothetical protein
VWIGASWLPGFVLVLSCPICRAGVCMIRTLVLNVAFPINLPPGDQLTANKSHIIDSYLYAAVRSNWKLVGVTMSKVWTVQGP